MTTLDPSQFIQHHNQAILSTFSVSHPGYPFGSMVPYIISSHGRLAIYISELAEHTKNILANPHVALTISEQGDDSSPSSAARVTCLGQVFISENQTQLKQIYKTQFSDADMILELPGFVFYELELTAIRLIAGFGQISWLQPDQIELIKR